MKRINYLVTRSERLVGVTLPTTLAPRLRGPLGALAGALALVGGLHAFEGSRLASAAQAGRLAADQLAATEIAVTRVRAVERDVVRLSALVDRVAETQRSGPAQAAAITAIGNRIPPDAWLASLRVDRAGYALQGHGARLSAVGTTMAALATLPAATGARLLDVHDEPDRAGVSYALALETRR